MRLPEEWDFTSFQSAGFEWLVNIEMPVGIRYPGIKSFAGKLQIAAK